MRSNSLEMMERLTSLLPPGTKESKRRKVDTIFSFLYGGDHNSPIKRFNIIYRNVENLGKALGQTDMLLGRLESDIQLCVAELAQTRFFIHAGAVGWKGRAILIPARSQRGKSTLVRKLVEAGATFYSDEYAVLDEFGRVHPFPRPIGVRDDMGRDLQRIRPEELGARVGKKPIPVGLVLLSEYHAGALWSPKPLSPGQAALKILSNSVSVRRQPAFLLKLMNCVTASATVVESRRGEAEQVTEWVMQAFPVSG